MKKKVSELVITMKVDATWSDILKLLLLRILPRHRSGVTIQDLIEKDRK